MGSPTKTSAISLIDAWQKVLAGTILIGETADLSDSYSSLFYLEVVPVDAGLSEQSGVIITPQVSYADERWVDLQSLVSPKVATPYKLAIAVSVSSGATTITVTDATGFTPGTKWLLEGEFVTDSEVFIVKSVSGLVITLADPLLNDHTQPFNVWAFVSQWSYKFPLEAAKGRILYNDTDSDSDIMVTTRLSKVDNLNA